MERNHSQFVFERKRRTDDIFKRRTFPLQSPALYRAQKSVLTNRKRRMLPISAIVPVIVLSLVLGNVGGTASYFSDVENSTANVLLANAFDFNLSVTPNEYTLDVTAIDPVGPIMPLAVPLPGSKDGQYDVTVEKTGGSDAFCAALFVDASSVVPVFSYINPLLSLTTNPGTITGPLSMLVSVSGDVSTVMDGDSCSVDLIYTGFEKDGPSGTGYTDVERVSLLFRASVPVPIGNFSAPEGILRATSMNSEVPPPPTSEDAQEGFEPEKDSTESEEGDSIDEENELPKDDTKPDDKKNKEGEHSDVEDLKKDEVVAEDISPDVVPPSEPAVEVFETQNHNEESAPVPVE